MGQMAAVLVALALGVVPGAGSRTDQLGDGTTQAFAFTFKATAAAHVKVYVDADGDGPGEFVAQVAGFTTTLNANQEASPGGTVTFAVAPADDAVVRIQRETPRTQGTVYSPYSAFPAKTTERALDNIVMQTQEVERKIEDVDDFVRALPAAGAAEAATSAVVAASHANAAATARTGAEAARDQTFTARDAAVAAARVYPSTAAGLTALAEGDYFYVPSAENSEALILYREVSNAAVETKRVASSKAVFEPQGTGKLMGWPDPFFRRFDLTSETLLGRDRWFWNGVGIWGPFGGWTRVPNSVFDGFALRRGASWGTTPLNGPSIWLDDLDAEPGDTITVYTLLVGDGAVVTVDGRFYNVNDSVGSALGIHGLTETGAEQVTTSATPQWARHVVEVPADPAGMVKFNLYPFTLTGAATFDIVALWAFKGDETSGPRWPVAGDEQYYRMRDAEFETRVAAVETVAQSAITSNAEGEVRGAFVPYVALSHVLGAGESDGDADYANIAKVMGFYEQTPEATVFNTVTGRIWSTDPAANVEWRVWVRDSAAIFNMGTEPYVASGTIPAAEFPHSNTLYTFRLPTPVRTNAGQYVFVMFRPANDTTISARRWLYNAGVSPARHGFPFQTVNGWASNVAFGAPASGYGQVAMTLYMESEEIRAKGESAVASAPSLVITPKVYVTEGREASIYFDNLLPESADDYLWDVQSGPAAGKQQNERWTITPTGSIASTAMTILAVDRKSGQTVTSVSTNVVGAAASAGTGTNRNVIFIGDSLTNAGIYTGEVVAIDALDPMNVTLYGTRGSGANLHEGRGGWTINTYTSNYTDGYGTNPFWIGGAVNFPQYLTNNSIPVPDWVFIMLGINDSFGYTTDAAVVTAAATAFDKLDTLITSIKAAGPSVKVVLMTPTPPSAEQDAFGKDYAAGQTRWRFKRNIAVWARQLISRYSGQEGTRTYLLPAHVNIDTLNNMVREAAAPVNSRSTVQVSRQGNGVHPDSPGYRQIADSVWAFLKNNP